MLNFKTMNFIIRIIVSTLAVLITAYLIPGVKVTNVMTAIIVAAVLGLLNTFIKPLLVLLTIPITIVTLGLFLLVINACMILLAAQLVDGFEVTNFWSALFFSIIMALVNGLLHSLAKDKKNES